MRLKKRPGLLNGIIKVLKFKKILKNIAFIF